MRFINNGIYIFINITVYLLFIAVLVCIFY